MKTICDEFEASGYDRVVAGLRHRGIVVNAEDPRLMREHALIQGSAGVLSRQRIAITLSDLFNFANNMKLDGPNQLW